MIGAASAAGTRRAESSTTLTYLFTDVEGSTSQWETALDMSDRIEQHFAILRRCVVEHGGEVFAMLGDGIGAAFASAAAAARAAVDAQRRLPETGLRVRMGLHTGEARRVGDDFRGRALNRAARIMAAGHGRQVLVSDVTASLLRQGPDPAAEFGLIDLGVHSLRDLAEPEHLWQLAHGEPGAGFPPLRSTRRGGPGVPRHRTSFVGRRPDVCEVVARVREHPITTLTGPGGVGKTRLALRAAFDAVADPEHVWFADLAPVVEPDRVGEVVARAAGLDGAAPSFSSLADAIGDRHALLVLDNCEHVLDVAAELTDVLAGACQNLRILATSREALLIPGEFVVAIAGLDPASDAIELFEQRAAASGASIDPAHRPVIERICRRLGGLPLAIELAAARVPLFGLHGVEALLDRPFDVLVARTRGGDERHRTMFAAIDWSYRLLDRDERCLLEWLAVFVGGFELDAALAIGRRCGGTNAGAAELLDSLVRKSMIEVDDGPAGVRYRVLESIRAFALDQLAASDEVAAAHAAHAEWMASVTEAPFDEPCTASVEQAALRIERETDNWARAMTTATQSRSLALIERLCSPATAHFVVSRHDLSSVLLRAADVCTDGPARRSVACCLACASTGSPDPTLLPFWNAELQRLDAGSGTAHLIRWMALTWEGRTDDGIEWCLRGAADARFSQDTKDLFMGIATVDRFSLTDSTDDLARLLAASLDVIDRTDVNANRVIALLGAAWALLPTEPSFAMQLVQEAVDGVPLLPLYMRRTIPGNVARFMATIDTALGAAYVLERIGDGPGSNSFLELIPVAYAASVLDRTGHPDAERILATLAASAVEPYLGRIDLDRRARAALLATSPLPMDELLDLVRDALGELTDRPSAMTVEATAC